MSDALVRIQRIKESLSQLGPILPGTVSTQWNVCGKPGCRCKDPKKPRRHGPYYQLSFNVGGKSSTMFVKETDLEALRECTRRYKRFRELNTELLRAHILWARDGGLHQQEGATDG